MKQHPGRLCFAIYKEGGRQSVLEDLALPRTKSEWDRDSRQVLVWTYKEEGRQSVLKNLGLPPIKTKGRQSVLKNFGLPPVKTKGRQCVLKNLGLSPIKTKGRQGVLENLGLPPTKTKGRQSVLKSLGLPPTKTKGRQSFATEKKTGAERKGRSRLTTTKGKPRQNMILKGSWSATDRERPWEYLANLKSQF